MSRGGMIKHEKEGLEKMQQRKMLKVRFKIAKLNLFIFQHLKLTNLKKSYSRLLTFLKLSSLNVTLFQSTFLVSASNLWNSTFLSFNLLTLNPAQI